MKKDTVPFIDIKEVFKAGIYGFVVGDALGKQSSSHRLNPVPYNHAEDLCQRISELRTQI